MLYLTKFRFCHEQLNGERFNAEKMVRLFGYEERTISPESCWIHFLRAPHRMWYKSIDLRDNCVSCGGAAVAGVANNAAATASAEPIFGPGLSASGICRCWLLFSPIHIKDMASFYYDAESTILCHSDNASLETACLVRLFTRPQCVRGPMTYFVPRCAKSLYLEFFNQIEDNQ